jgi:hypothetical protein
VGLSAVNFTLGGSQLNLRHVGIIPCARKDYEN